MGRVRGAARAGSIPIPTTAPAPRARPSAGQQRERFREGLPTVSACRDLGQLCPPEGAAEPASSAASTTAEHTTGSDDGSDPRPGETALRAEDITLTVLVSRSLGAAQLKEIFAFAADTPRVRVAFRGVAEDESLMDFVRQIHGLLAGIEPVPEVVLDPTPFAAAGVDIAPVLLAQGPDGELARVAGLADPFWLRSRVLAGERGDLGVLGPVKPVTEPDLIEELQRRLAALDLDRLRERALERYWQRVAFETLPVAAEPRTREIDPTITAPRDLRSADGTLLVRAGETLNPLDRLPFTQRLVVFDASDERQVATAKTPRNRRLASGACSIWRPNSSGAGAGRGSPRWRTALDAPVYLLTPDVRQRFALERVPAFVEARGRVFIVAEVPPETGPMSRGLRVVSAVLLLLCLRPLQAADPGCPDAELFSGKLITDICWGCLFPIRIAGLSIGGGDRPAAASNQVVCACNDALGVPHPGFVVSLWEPARIVELTRAPACSPALGGIRLPLGSRRLLGTAGKSEWDASDISFYNYHWYAFPLLTLLDLFFEDRCNADGMVDFDILYLSELDPTWNSGELAFFTNPEAAWLANPVALAACLADAASATAGTPIDALFWCAGTWGLLYPFSGAMPNYGSRPSETSLSATRALAALHRRGLARRTLGDAALCSAPIDPFLTKSQYRMSMFYPLPETQSNHVIGESAFRWGEWRSLPGPGEDHLYLLWRWNDCCATF